MVRYEQCIIKFVKHLRKLRTVVVYTTPGRYHISVERQQQSLEQQHQDHQHSMDQLQKQYRELQQVLNTSTEHQLQIQRRETQLKELTKLRETLAKYENCRYMCSFTYYCFSN